MVSEVVIGQLTVVCLIPIEDDVRVLDPDHVGVTLSVLGLLYASRLAHLRYDIEYELARIAHKQGLLARVLGVTCREDGLAELGQLALEVCLRMRFSMTHPRSAHPNLISPSQRLRVE